MAETEAAADGGNKKLIIIIGVLVGVLMGGGVGVFMFLGADKGADPATAEAAPEPKAESQYVQLDPEFVINFRDKSDRPKFLKAEMSVATDDEDVVEAVTRHMPAIRNAVVLLLSRQVYDDLVPHEGKEQLRTETLKAVQEVLEKQIGKPGVDDLLFSSFVMH